MQAAYLRDMYKELSGDVAELLAKARSDSSTYIRVKFHPAADPFARFLGLRLSLLVETGFGKCVFVLCSR